MAEALEFDVLLLERLYRGVTHVSMKKTMLNVRGG